MAAASGERRIFATWRDLDPQRLVHRQLQTFIHRLHDGARRRIIVIGLAAIDRVLAARNTHHSVLGIDLPAGQLETVNVPRRLRRAAGLDPVFRRLHQVCLRHHRVDQLHRFGAIEPKLIALEQKLQGVRRLHHTRDPLRAAATGKQADFDLRQAKPRLVVLGGDAMMAGERQFEPTAHRGAVESGDPRFATGFHAAGDLRELAAFLEHALVGGFLALCGAQFGKRAAERFQHGQVGTAAERLLAGGQHGAFDGGVAGDLLDHGRQLFHHLCVDDVHRAVGHGPGDERDAVGVNVGGEILQRHTRLRRLNALTIARQSQMSCDIRLIRHKVCRLCECSAPPPHRG